jgi:hypothetical protein
MAKMGKSKPTKPVAKTTDVKVATKGRTAKSAKSALTSASAGDSKSTVGAAPAGAAKKEVSQKLIETIEKRKKAAAKGSPFARPPGRRGRRPRGTVEYTPEHQEEDGFQMEPDYEGLEYDTGIRVKHHAEDRGFNLDVDFDEELNFDW